jgi:hypothetical protein
MPIWSANGTAGKMGARRPGQLAKNDNDLAEANKQQVSPIARSMMLRWSTSAFGGQRGAVGGALHQNNRLPRAPCPQLDA